MIELFKNFGIFGSCFQSLLGGTRVAFNLVLIIPQPWVKTLLSIFYQMLHELCGVSTWQVGRVTLPGPVSDKNIFLQTGKVLLSPASVSSHKWDDSYSAEHFGGFFGVCPVCSSLHSDLLCKPQLHWSLWPSALVSSLQSIYWVIPEFLPFVPWPGNAPKAVSWGNWKDCFASCSSVLLRLMSTVLKDIVAYILPVFLFDSGVNLVSATPLLGTEMVCWNL